MQGAGSREGGSGGDSDTGEEEGGEGPEGPAHGPGAEEQAGGGAGEEEEEEEGEEEGDDDEEEEDGVKDVPMDAQYRVSVRVCVGCVHAWARCLPTLIHACQCAQPDRRACAVLSLMRMQCLLGLQLAAALQSHACCSAFTRSYSAS